MDIVRNQSQRLTRNEQRVSQRYQKRNQLSGYGVGFFLLLFFAMVLLLATIGFVCKIPVTKAHLFVSFFATAGAMLFYYEKKTTIKIAGISLLVIVVSIVAASYVFDESWDGGTYRKTLSFMLQRGYNPIYETFSQAIDRIGLLNNREWETWYDAYPKGSELFAAVVYSVTGNIESGKCFNLLLIVSAFLIAFDLFMQLFAVKRVQAFFCALLLCVQPVTLAQVNTFYNDGALGLLLYICILSMLALSLQPKEQSTKYGMTLVFVSIVCGFNLKFSAILYFAFYVAAFYVFWFVRDYKAMRQGDKQAAWKKIKQYTAVVAGAVLCGFLVIGSTSYVMNTIRFHNPLYTMIGDGSTEIITSQSPLVLQSKSHFKRFAVSFFSQTSNDKLLASLQLKKPFRFYPAEWEAFSASDIRIAGWGILFSGIAIISALIVCVYLLKMLRKNKTCFALGCLLLGTTFLPVFFVPGLYWARYFTQFFLLPAFAVLIAFSYANQRKTKPGRVLWQLVPAALCSLLALNCWPSIYHGVQQYKVSCVIRTQLQQVSDVAKQHPIRVRSLRREDINGPLINLMDAGVERLDIDEDMQHYDGRFHGVYKVGYQFKDNAFRELRQLEQYLPLLQNPDFVVLMAIRDEGTQALSVQAVQQLHSLGLQTDFANAYRNSYLAVVDGGKVLHEASAKTPLFYETQLLGHVVTMESGGFFSDQKQASICVDDVEFAVNRRGLNIVVLHKKTKTVLDSVVFDTFLDAAAIRQYCDYAQFAQLPAFQQQSRQPIQ